MKSAPPFAASTKRTASFSPIHGMSAALACCSISAFQGAGVHVQFRFRLVARTSPTTASGATLCSPTSRRSAPAVDLPVNADFESGFAGDPEGLAENVRLAIDTGISGLSIEDRQFDADGLYDLDFAVARIRAARAAIDASGQDVILVARTEGLLIDPAALSPAIDKLVAFAEAGADCLYAPGVREPADIATMVRAVAPLPLNVLVMRPEMRVAELAELGVRRISIGGALARVAWGAAIAAAEAMQAGLFDGLAGGAPGKRLNDMFAGFEDQK